jgi:hypothetical protein
MELTNKSSRIGPMLEMRFSTGTLKGRSLTSSHIDLDDPRFNGSNIISCSASLPRFLYWFYHAGKAKPIKWIDFVFKEERS